MTSVAPLDQRELNALPAEEVLRRAHEEFGDRLCLTRSWQKQSSVLVHMVSELGLDVDVIALDTHLLFPETYETRPPRPALRALTRLARRPDRRRAARAGRAQPLGKLNPLADWSEEDVWRYIAANAIPYNPLHDRGYRSIGCVPCTRPTRAGEEERAGRWAGFDKLECGIHGERSGE